MLSCLDLSRLLTQLTQLSLALTLVPELVIRLAALPYDTYCEGAWGANVRNPTLYLPYPTKNRQEEALQNKEIPVKHAVANIQQATTKDQ